MKEIRHSRYHCEEMEVRNRKCPKAKQANLLSFFAVEVSPLPSQALLLLIVNDWCSSLK
jgi:hypothetical protein